MNQIFRQEQLLRRAITHCNWGVSDTKVLGLLASRPCHSAKLVLSPTVTTLRQAVCQFSSNKLQVLVQLSGKELVGYGERIFLKKTRFFLGGASLVIVWGHFSILYKLGGNKSMNESFHQGVVLGESLRLRIF